MTMNDYWNKPCAVHGLTSYRCKAAYGGWIMIGAKDNDDAWREAQRSSKFANQDTLEVWDGKAYRKVAMST